MFNIMMIVGDEAYVYGTYTDRDRANEIAMQVREQRGIETYVEEAQNNDALRLFSTQHRQAI